MGPLDDTTVARALERLPGWARDGDSLVKSFRRRNWADAIAFVNAIAPEADRRNHHPDLCVTGYRTVTVRLTSHDAGGITQRDVDLAGWIEERSTDGT